MPTKIVGVDQQSASLKIVEVLQSFKKIKVIGATTADKPESFSGMNDEEISAVGAPFPQELITNRLTHFPFTAAKKLEQATPFELESWVPFSVEDFITDYQVLKKEKNQSTVLIAGTKKENIRNWITKWETIGLNPNFAVPEGFAYRALARLLVKDEETPLAFLNIGNEKSVFAVTVGDRTALARSLPWGLKNTEEIGPDTKTNADFSRLASEIKNTLRYISVEEGIEVSQLILCGDMAKTDGLAESLSEKTGIEAKIWFAPPELEANVGPEYALALAVALEQTHPIKGINLRKDEFTHRPQSVSIKNKIIFPALLIVGVVILMLINTLLKNKELQAKSATLDAKIAAIAGGVLGDNNVSPQNALATLDSQLETIKKMEEIIGKSDYLTPLQALTAIHQLLPENVDADIDEVTLDGKTLTITGSINDYSQMDTITNALKRFDAFKKFETPSLREKMGKKGGVQFTQKILLTIEEEEKPKK